MSGGSFRLNNGVEIPTVGFGLFQTPPDETVRAVAAALELPIQGGTDPLLRRLMWGTGTSIRLLRT